jgi:D-beta-D-heptose 7-phosphate kinase/D-beta-D-heptose 1-phosphate adenosyltransferase
MTPSPTPPAPPDRAAESAALLAGIVGRLGTPHVFVVGDLILDRYTWGDAERVSPEAPVLVLRSSRSEHRLGGAASVAFLLRALGARVTLAGVVGDDAAGATVRQLLNAAGVDCKPVVTDRDRPTTVKERFMGVAQHRHAHQILRVDHEAREPLASETESELSRRLSGAVDGADAVLVSDYGKGVCTAGLIPGLISSARWANRPVLVDPARGADYERYRGATCVTPNRREAEEAAGVSIRRPGDAVTAARRLCRRHNLDAAVVTLDRDGMALARSDGRNGVYPARERRVYDITGAGDVVLSVLGVCLAAGVDFPEAIALANVAGGIEVESVGVAPVTWAEVLADLGAARPAGA